MNERIIKELLSYKDEIDKIINTIKGSAAVSSDDEDQFYSGKTDPDYDNEEIPPPYTKKYIRRRINVFLSFFYQELIETFTSHTNREISMLDLGAGTGAVQWALYLLLGTLEKMNMLNLKKNISIVNMDSSSFMLDYNKKLWKRFFEEKIKQSKSFTISPTWKRQDLKSINNYNDIKTPSIITASYLLPYRDKDKIIDIINRLVRKYECSLLLTTSPKKGRGLEGEITSAQLKFPPDCTEHPVYDGYDCKLLFDNIPHWEEYYHKVFIVWKS